MYNQGQPWTKRAQNNCSVTFDITMGSYHRAEVCELVGLYMLNKITSYIPKENLCIYRDDGLAVIRRQSGFKTEKLKQQLHGMAHKMGLKLEIEGPMKVTDFLDLSFNLETEKYSPFRKINNEIQYISTSSNHPPNIIKQIPKMISKRLSKRSINKEEFDKIADP